MPRPRKYTSLYGSQEAYRRTEKGKEAQRKSQASNSTKQKKRDWWRKNRGKNPLDRKQHFIDTYGGIESALALLDERQQFVIKSLNGLDGNKPLTQKAIASQLDLTPQRISQIKIEAEELLAPLKRQTETENESDDQ